MSYVVEHFPEQHVVVDNNGDIRVPDDYLDGDGYSFKEIPDTTVLYDATDTIAVAERVQRESDRYYEALDAEEQKVGSFDIARMNLARRGLVEPTQELRPEPNYSAISKAGAEAIRATARDAAIAKVKREILDPQEQEKAIVLINADYRVKASRRDA
jgi:hypothetical protein